MYFCVSEVFPSLSAVGRSTLFRNSHYWLEISQEREEESKRLKQLRLTEEAEAKRLANESARREEARIRKEIDEKELEEARLLLAEAEKRKGKKGKKAAPDGVRATLTISNWH